MMLAELVEASRVIRLWQLDGEALLALQRPALLALIGQTRLQDPKPILSQAVRQIIASTSGERQAQLLTEFLLLCSDKELAAMAEQIIRYDRYGIPESPLISEWREKGRLEGIEKGRLEGIEKGRLEGIEKGREEERLALLLRLIIPITVEQTACPMTFKRIETPCPVFSYRLSAIGFGITHRYGAPSTELTARVQALTATQMLDLTDALFDFTSRADLDQWLAQQP